MRWIKPIFCVPGERDIATREPRKWLICEAREHTLLRAESTDMWFWRRYGAKRLPSAVSRQPLSSTVSSWPLCSGMYKVLIQSNVPSYAPLIYIRIYCIAILRARIQVRINILGLLSKFNKKYLLYIIS